MDTDMVLDNVTHLSICKRDITVSKQYKEAIIIITLNSTSTVHKQCDMTECDCEHGRHGTDTHKIDNQ